VDAGRLSQPRCTRASGAEQLAHMPGARISLKFNKASMLISSFDVEAVFVTPWAVASRQLGRVGIASFRSVVSTSRRRKRNM
jgi:NADH:ubiquinone oxidoreductase subunit 3 (subunit A)